MSLAGRNRRASLKLICVINMTAFLSIQAALLAMFMVLPMSYHDLPKGPSVDLAKVGHPALMRAAEREDAMVVAVMRTGDVYFLGDKTVAEQLDFKIRKRLALGSEKKVYINAEARAKIRSNTRGPRSGAVIGCGACWVLGGPTKAAVASLDTVGLTDGTPVAPSGFLG